MAIVYDEIIASFSADVGFHLNINSQVGVAAFGRRVAKPRGTYVWQRKFMFMMDLNIEYNSINQLVLVFR